MFFKDFAHFETKFKVIEICEWLNARGNIADSVVDS